MKKTLLFSALFNILFSLFTLNSYAQAPDFVWAKSAVGSKNDNGQSIAVDASGNLYITGVFSSSTITFGTTTLTNNGYENIFIVKYDASGNVVWAKSAGGSSYDYGVGISVDASGNSYITGYFSSPTIIFDTITLTNKDNTGNSPDIFITKYDVSGNVVWAKSVGGSGWDNGYGISIDASGNSYITGSFSSFTITFGTTTLTNNGSSNIFLAKYDALGNVVWAKSASGIGYYAGNSISVDDSGNSYIIGSFERPTIIFGSNILTNKDSTTSNTSDIFIVKYDASGNVVWAKSAGGSSYDYGVGISVDASGNSYITGYFSSPTIIFDTITLTNKNNTGNTTDIFIAKYDVQGNVIWAKSVGGTGNDMGQGISIDASGNSYITGYFSSPTITFGLTTLSNNGSDNIFIAKYDTSGNVVWAKSAGESYSDVGYSISVDANGNSYITGYFSSPTITFGSDTLSNNGSGNIFIAKLASSDCFSYFTLTPDVTTPHHYYVTDSTIGVSPLKYYWSWGDGTHDTIAYPSHTYSAAGNYKICLTITDFTGCTSTYCDSSYLQKSTNSMIYVDVVPKITGVKENELSNQIKFYPNPATDNFQIQTSLQIKNIEITDITGRMIHTTTNKTINCSGFAKGVYFVKVETEKGIEVEKIIKE